eukprot:5510483-Amphidinium_carterae.1
MQLAALGSCAAGLLQSCIEVDKCVAIFLPPSGRAEKLMHRCHDRVLHGTSRCWLALPFRWLKHVLDNADDEQMIKASTVKWAAYVMRKGTQWGVYLLA